MSLKALLARMLVTALALTSAVPAASAFAASGPPARVMAAKVPTAIAIEVRPNFHFTETAVRDSEGRLHYKSEATAGEDGVKTFNLLSVFGWLVVIGIGFWFFATLFRRG